MRRTRTITGILLLAAALLCAAAAAGTAFFCRGRSPVNLTALPDPAETLRAFFDAVCEERFADAYALLDSCDGLGLENEPEDAVAALLWDSLRASLRWEAGECRVEGTEAEALVTLRFLDLPEAMRDLGAEVNDQLAERVREAVRAEEVYDENGQYRQELVLALYREAVEARLSAGSLPEREEDFTIRLRYTDSAWHIVPDAALYAALSGGVG